jgi:hypothetical protein
MYFQIKNILKSNHNQTFKRIIMWANNTII